MLELKIKAAQAALAYLDDHSIVGVGSGSTVNCFIDLLAQHKHNIEACVAGSNETARRLIAHGIRVLELPVVDELNIYFDGADEVNSKHQMIKGGGGALTREKILATAAKTFVCMVDSGKWVNSLGKYPIAVEVLPMARSLVARALVDLGGDPVYRHGFVTDNGNIILDSYHLNPELSSDLEDKINCIPGVVENGLFLHRRADIVLVSGVSGVETKQLS